MDQQVQSRRGNAADRDDDGYPVAVGQENRLRRELRRGDGQLRGFNYFITSYVYLDAATDTAAVAAGLAVVVARHEALRTSFSHGPAGLRQHIHEPPATITVHERQIHTQDEAVDALREAYAKPFDPDAALFLRAVLLRRDPFPATLALICEHLVADAIAMQLLRDEVVEAIEAAGQGRSIDPAPEQRLQFKDWAQRQRDELAAGEDDLISYWREALGPAGPYPPSSLFHPLDGVEPAKLCVLIRRWDDRNLADLGALVDAYQMSQFVAVFAATQIALAAVTGQDDVVLYTTSGNRVAEDEFALFGWCAHGLPCRLVLSAQSTLADAIDNVREAMLSGLVNQAIPLTRLVAALAPDGHAARRYRPPRYYLGYLPLDEVPPDALQLDEVDIDGATRWAHPGLSIDIEVGPDELRLVFNYGEGRMDTAVLDRLATTMRRVVTLAASQPETTIAELRAGRPPSPDPLP